MSIPFVSVNVLQDQLSGSSIEFFDDARGVLVSELLEDEEGPPFVYVVRSCAGVIQIELVTVEENVWIRQLHFKPGSLKEVQAFFQRKELVVPTPGGPRRSSPSYACAEQGVL